MSESESPAGKSVEERASASRLKLLVLLRVRRNVLAAAVLFVLFLGIVVASQVAPSSLRGAISSSDPIETTFQALVTAIITGVTLVVTINQLVLSQELGPLGDQRERMEGAMEFREDVESVLDTPTIPPDPASFLGTILDAARGHAETLTDAADQVSDSELRDRIQSYADGVATDAEDTRSHLDDAQFGTYGVVSAALRFNYAGRIYDARSIAADADDLPDDVLDALDSVETALRFFGPAREHAKTLYFQWELINLSRKILYAAVPALIVSISMILFATDAAMIPGSILGVDNFVWLSSVAITVALTPFVILLVYVLRIGTVAKRTLAIGPIILRDTNRSGEGDRR